MTQVTGETVTTETNNLPTLANKYDDIQDQVVRSIRSHASEQTTEHYIKQFSDNKFINENQEKDVEDVIRMYWQLQNTEKNKGYLINPFQQRVLKFFKENPLFIKKLYGCRSNFAHQRKKYTESVQAIIKFGKYPMFTTEYDVSINPPILSGSSSWGEISGLADKQLCIVIANEETTFIKSMTSIDDKKYACGIAQLFNAFSTAPNLKYISNNNNFGKAPMTLLGDYAYIEGNNTKRNDINDTRGKESDKYDIIYGNPFSGMSSNSSSTPNNNSFDPRTGFSPNAFGAMNTYTGIISIYGLFEAYCFEIEKYREFMLPYFLNNRLKNDNLQMYNYVWNRMEPFLEKLFRSFVDRAILSAHQNMIDYLISIYEANYTIPQIFKYFCPGTMVKIKTSYDVIQTAMVLKSSISDKSDGLALHLHVLNPNVTKTDNIFVHDIWITSNVQKSKSDYHAALVSAPNRGVTCFRYYSVSNNITLMKEEDIPNQLAFIVDCLRMISKPSQKDMDGNYYWNEYKWGQKSTNQKPYKGRVVVDYNYSRSGWSDFDPEKATVTKTVPEIVDLITLDHYKELPVYPGSPFKESSGEGDASLVITPDHIYSDIKVALSFPIVATAFALRDKKWCLVKLNDIKEPVYKEDAYEKLVMDEDRKGFMKIITVFQEKNTFKDLIDGKESGAVFLLNGASGQGKSALVESISELLHKPLYQVTSGELGAEPSDVERAFVNLLDNATRWNAIVQIDEADIYLRKRDNDDIKRNAIVSIFLRQLEYFNGVIFLTSNLADEIDPAFDSRIIQKFQFKKLESNDRKQIWKNLLDRQGVTITDKQAATLAADDINGRQIKNIIKAAISMSLAKEKPLDYPILVETMELMKKSSKDIVNEKS